MNLFLFLPLISPLSFCKAFQLRSFDLRSNVTSVERTHYAALRQHVEMYMRAYSIGHEPQPPKKKARMDGSLIDNAAPRLLTKHTHKKERSTKTKQKKKTEQKMKSLEATFLSIILLPLGSCFHPTVPPSSSVFLGKHATKEKLVVMSLSTGGGEKKPPPEPLNEKEIEELLEGVPVYALTSIENDSVLLIEEDGKNVANFFLSKEFADTVVEGHGDNLRVDVFSLGKLYFPLFAEGSDATTGSSQIGDEIKIITTNELDVEYRLVPDTREVDQGRSILSQMAGVDDAFSTGYNDIPLFMDQHLRLGIGSEERGDYKEIFPIYFGWNDLVKTCQEYVRAFADAGEEYEAAISVSELSQLVAQMKQPSPEDFRNVQFIPSSPRPLDS